MRFITEGDLRDLYKKQNFSSYIVEPGTKITPGAREFLVDRKITIEGYSTAKKINAPVKIKKNLGMALEIIECRLRSLEALSLSFAEELLDDDIGSAQRMIELGEAISICENLVKGSGHLKEFNFKGCRGIDGNSVNTDLGDCFRINAFHIQLKRGKGIIRFHRLRCALRELKADINTIYESSGKDRLYEDLNTIINRMINTLSQHICDAAGGEECQIKK